jgi:RNA polymerase sigma-70 factor (ECF subfamily)
MTHPRQTKELVERAQAGDRGAFDELIGLHRGRIEALIGSRLGARLGRELELDDVLQETLLGAFRSLGSFRWRGEDSFLRWLGGIAEHVILTAARRARRHPEVPLDREVAASGDSPSRELRRGERFERFQAALDSLDPEARQVITLARLEGHSVQEVARRMGRTPNAVSILLYRSLIKLKAAFGDTESLRLPRRRLEDNGEPGGRERHGR